MDNNKLVERYITFVDEVSNQFGYDSNIRHLLYLIIPGFVKKYGIHRENLVMNVFRNVRVFMNNEKNEIVNAYYTSIPRYIEDRIVTNKMIVINNYEKIPLVNLLDNLVHEFNHAVNSYHNEIRWDEKKLYLRTGLTWSIYDKKSLHPIEKDISYVLEEIINTRQTEEIINIIKSFKGINNEIDNTIYSINNETHDSYSSKAYFLESYICKKILENRTFISTLENLRISGDVSDIEGWFDNIVGKSGTYQKFIHNLNQILSMEMELTKVKYFKNFKIHKLRRLSQELMEIVLEFDQNCHYS